MPLDFSDFHKEQDLLIERINAVSSDCKSPIKTLNKQTVEFFEEIAKIPQVEMDEYLGDFGSALAAFVQMVDISHPFVHQMFDQNQINEKELKAVVEELICVQKNLVGSSQIYSSSILKNNAARHFLKPKKVPSTRQSFMDMTKKKIEKEREDGSSIEDPLQIFINKFAKPSVCLLKSPEMREKRRKFKTSKFLATAGKSEIVESCDDLKIYYFASCLESEIATLKKMAEVFRSNNFDYFAQTADRRIAKIVNLSSERHCNFVKIDTKIASLICAKLMNFVAGGQIRVPVKYFAGDTAFRTFEPSGTLTYQARFHPLGKMTNVPERVKKILEYTEACPDLNGKPIFDYYWVLVPSIDIPYDLTGSVRVKMKLNGEDCIVNLERKEEEDGKRFYHKLDQYLIEKNMVMPIVMGEKSGGGGTCYFISYYC